jgi:hypothetical protein
MKPTRLFSCIALLCASTAAAEAAQAADLQTLRMDDPSWVKEAGDHLARCAGTYRGVAEVMRGSGREQAASYAESVGSGALFAAYLLLTSPTAVAGKVLAEVDPNAHIEALAWGTKRNLIMMDKSHEPGSLDALRGCTQTSALQSSVLLGATEGAQPEDGTGSPAQPIVAQAAKNPDSR